MEVNGFIIYAGGKIYKHRRTGILEEKLKKVGQQQ
jgi:hypothetical protein